MVNFLKNATMKLHDIDEYDYAVLIVTSDTIINNIDIESYNNKESKGIYADSNSHVTASNVNINLHDNTNSYGMYVNNGSLTLKNGTLNVSGTNTYGSSLASGSLTIESGTINSNGTTSYGVRMTNGTYTQGIYDGRGTESADVSLTDPSITATGKTTGIGVSMGSGTMKYYDGYIHGSTSAFATGDIVSETEKNYQLLLSDENRTSVLEYTR